jgi:hypothetical protein
MSRGLFVMLNFTVLKDHFIWMKKCDATHSKFMGITIISYKLVNVNTSSGLLTFLHALSAGIQSCRYGACESPSKCGR